MGLTLRIHILQIYLQKKVLFTQEDIYIRMYDSSILL
jgi:hypothetical protein